MTLPCEIIDHILALTHDVSIAIRLGRTLVKNNLLRETKKCHVRDIEHAKWLHEHEVSGSWPQEACHTFANEGNMEHLRWVVENHSKGFKFKTEKLILEAIYLQNVNMLRYLFSVFARPDVSTLAPNGPMRYAPHFLSFRMAFYVAAIEVCNKDILQEIFDLEDPHSINVAIMRTYLEVPLLPFSAIMYMMRQCPENHDFHWFYSLAASQGDLFAVTAINEAGYTCIEYTLHSAVLEHQIHVVKYIVEQTDVLFDEEILINVTMIYTDNLDLDMYKILYKSNDFNDDELIACALRCHNRPILDYLLHESSTWNIDEALEIAGEVGDTDLMEYMKYMSKLSETS